MSDAKTAALWVVPMILLIVGMDVLFFRESTWFWERLAGNVGTVLIFGAFYYRFVLRA